MMSNDTKRFIVRFIYLFFLQSFILAPSCLLSMLVIFLIVRGSEHQHAGSCTAERMDEFNQLVAFYF